MAGQLLNEGLNYLSEATLGVASDDLYVKLFTNSLANDPTHTLGDFVSPSDAGVQPILLTPSSWTLSSPTGGAIQWTYPNIAWIFAGTPTESYYGYVVYCTQLGVGLWMDTFDSPYPNSGGLPGLILALSVNYGAV